MSSEPMAQRIGFSNLPNLIQRKYTKRGIEFSLMLVGEPALGKKTLINSLFNLDGTLLKTKHGDSSNKAVTIETSFADIEERGVRLKLTIVQTPGYGSGLDCSSDYKPILNYIDEQYEKYLSNETGLNRRQVRDTRVHCCFYFIDSSNFGLKPIDVEFLKHLQYKINIIPLIAKADCLTSSEKHALKKQINAELKKHKIQVYIPDCDPDEDPAFQNVVDELKKSSPFAVSASSDTVIVNGRKVRARQYPWGTVSIDDPEHSDFEKLHSMLMSHMQDMRDITNEVHYENYRSQRLAGTISAGCQDSLRDNISMASDYCDAERERLLLEKDSEIRKMQEEIDKMKEEMKRTVLFTTNGNGNGNGNTGDDHLAAEV